MSQPITLQPITLLDYVEHVVGSKSSYTLEDHNNAGVPIIGGCADCHATVGSYNSCPTKRGYITCAEHTTIEDGFATVLEFEAWLVEQETLNSVSEDENETGQ